jgi:hypothetical protein
MGDIKELIEGLLTEHKNTEFLLRLYQLAHFNWKASPLAMHDVAFLATLNTLPAGVVNIMFNGDASEVDEIAKKLAADDQAMTTVRARIGTFFAALPTPAEVSARCATNHEVAEDGTLKVLFRPAESLVEVAGFLKFRTVDAPARLAWPEKDTAARRVYEQVADVLSVTSYDELGLEEGCVPIQCPALFKAIRRHRLHQHVLLTPELRAFLANRDPGRPFLPPTPVSDICYPAYRDFMSMIIVFVTMAYHAELVTSYPLTTAQAVHLVRVVDLSKLAKLTAKDIAKIAPHHSVEADLMIPGDDDKGGKRGRSESRTSTAVTEDATGLPPPYAARHAGAQVCYSCGMVNRPPHPADVTQCWARQLFQRFSIVESQDWLRQQLVRANPSPQFPRVALRK